MTFSRVGQLLGCPKTKTIAASREGRRLLRPRAETEALIALARAWTVTPIATALLFAVLAITPVWDCTTFRDALRDTSSGQPDNGIFAWFVMKVRERAEGL
jgi:hypothetical protein